MRLNRSTGKQAGATRMRASGDILVPVWKRYLSLAMCIILTPYSMLPIMANPTGGQVVQGQATISSAGNTLTIQQNTNRAVINWQNFSIDAGETTRFVQPSSSSAALNRVTSGNISSIYGSLEANGHVLLINPNGILIGESGRINVNTFIGSTFNLPNQDFMDGGDYQFSREGSSGNIKNLGSISATGGDVFLIANSVSNEGYIGATNGTIGIATGADEVLIKEAGEQRIFIRVKKEKKEEEEEKEETEVSETDGETQNSVTNDSGTNEESAENTENDTTPSGESERSETSDSNTANDNITNEEASSENVVTDEATSTEKPTEDTVSEENETSTEDSGDLFEVISDTELEEQWAKEDREASKDDLEADSAEPEYEWVAADQFKGSLGTQTTFNEPKEILAESDSELENSTAKESILLPDGLSVQERARQLLEEMDAASFVNKGTIESGISAEIQAVGGNSYALAINNEGIIRANGVEFDGSSGRITLKANQGIIQVSGVLDTSARMEATGVDSVPVVGGDIQVLGQNVAIMGDANIDASGLNGGGEILIGGSYQGKDESIMNAEKTFILDGATIKADAIESGDGGEVIVWADETTRFYGDISATGGTDSGDGGFVEVSGKSYLDYKGLVDLTAENGKTGNLLLDPTDITIQNAGPTSIEFAGTTFQDTTPDAASILTVADLQTQLGLAAITVTTNSAGAGTGNITVADSITWASGNKLTFVADNNVAINASITSNNADFQINATGNITQSAAVDLGAGTLTLTAADITLNNAGNDFGTVNATGGAIAIRDANAIDLGTISATTSLAFTAGGAITDSGTISANGVTTTISNAGNTVTLDSVANDFGTLAVTGSAISITDTDDIDLGLTTATTSLSISAGGAITDSGNVIANGITTTLDAGANAITLDSAGNDFGTLDVNGAVTNLAVTDTDDIALAAVTTSGTLGITAGGAITQSGTIVAGSTTTISNAGNTVTLTNAANNFGTIGVTGSTVQITDTNAIDLGTSTVTGALTVTAGGAITDSGNVVANGITTTLDAGANAITLDSAGNDFGTLDVNGAVTNLAVTDTDDIALAAVTTSGTLGITAGGAITQSGTIVAGSTTTISNAGNTVTLTNAANNFGTIGVTGSTVQITDTNAIDVGASTITGALTITAGGAITDSGNVIANGITTTLDAGANAITLDSAGNDFGTLDVNGAVTNLTVTDADDIALAAVAVANALNITAGGALTQTGAISVGTTTNISNAGNTVTLTNAANDFTGAVSMTGSTVQITDANAIDLGASTITTAFTVNAGGAVTDSGNISANGITTTINNAGNTITLDQAGSDFGTLAATGSAITVTDTDDIDLGNITATTSLSITVGGNITDSGTVSANGITTSLNAGTNNITLDSAASDYGTFDVNGAVNNVAVRDVDDIDIAAVTTTGTLGITAGGAVTDSGTIIAGGTTTVSAAGQNITLDQAANDFNTIELTGATVTVIDTDNIDFGASTVTTALNVTSGGAMTDSGTVNANGITTTLNAGANAITLDSAASDYGTLDVNGAVTNLAVRDTDDIDIAAVTTTGTFSVTAGGDVTDSGTIIVGTTSTLTTSGNSNITLDDAANEFTGEVRMTTTNGNVTLVDVSNFIIGNGAGSSIVGNFNLTTGTTGVTPVTQTQSISVTGTTTINTTGDTNNNKGSVTIVDTNNTYLGTSTIGGDYTMTTSGDYFSQSGATVRVHGDTTLVSTAGNIYEQADQTLYQGSYSASSSGSSNIIIRKSDGTDINVTDELNALIASPDITVDASGNHTVAADLVVVNESSAVSFSGAKIAGQAILLNNAGNDFGGTLNLTTDSQALTGGAITAGGIIQSKGIIANGTSSFRTDNTSQDIVLDPTDTAQTNTFTGDVSLVGRNITFVDSTATIIRHIDAGSGGVGNLTFTSGGNISDTSLISESTFINVEGNAVFTTSGASTVTLGNNGSDFPFSATGTKTTNFGTLAITTGSGDISVREDSNMNLNAISTTGNITMSTSGSIIDNNGATANFSNGSSGNAGILTLDAVTGIGDGDAIETQVASISAYNNTSGTIQIDEADDITILQLNNQAANANITLNTTNGSITVNTGREVETLDVNSSGSSNGDTVSFNVTVNGTTTALTTAGFGGTATQSQIRTAIINAINASAAVNATAATNVTAGNLTVTANNNGEDLSLSNFVFSAGASSVASTTTFASGVLANGGSIVLNADGTNSDVIINDDIDTSGAGTITITADDSIITNHADGDITSATGNITLTSNTDNIAGGNSGDGITTIANSVFTTTTGNINLTTQGTTAGGMSLAGTITSSTSGNIALDANGANSDIAISGPISTAGNATITINADDSITFSGTGGDLTATGTGAITLTANADGTTGGNGGDVLTMSDGTVINSDTGIIALNASGDITLGGLVNTNTTDTAISLTSSAGGIVDGGDTDVDIVTTTGGTTISTVTGIGSAGAIETTVAKVDLTNSTSGNVQITETDALNIKKVSQGGNGSVSITSNGATTVLDSGSGGSGIISTGTGTVTLNTGAALANTLDINHVITTNGGAVDIDAGGNINSTAAGDITTNNSLANTGTASGNVNILALNTGTITLSGDIITSGADNNAGNASNAGSITIATTDNTITTNAVITANGGSSTGANGNGGNAGNIIITTADTANDASHDLTVGVITSLLGTGNGTGSSGSSGTVTLTSDSAISDGNAGTLNITTDTLTMDATNGIGTNADVLEINVTTLDAENVDATGDVASNDIYLLETDDIIVNKLNNNVVDDTNDSTGRINLATTTGSITIASGQSGVNAIDGAITLDAGSGIAGSVNADVNINAAITNTSVGTLTISADDSVLFAAAGDYTSTGSGAVAVTSNVYTTTSGDTGNGITMTDGALINAGSGTISLTSSNANAGDITLGGLTTTNTTTSVLNGATAITIITDAGVVDGGDTHVDIDANSAADTGVRIEAVTGIGASNALETTVNRLDVDNATSNDIQIADTDNDGNALVVMKAQQATAGNISISTSSDSLTIDDQSGANNTNVSTVGSGNITLASGSGDITLNDGITSVNGNITLSAPQDVILSNLWTIDSTGSGNVTLTADSDGTNSGTGGKVNDNRNDPGNDDITLALTGTGGITINADEDIRIDSLSTAGSGSINLNSTSGAIVDGNGATNNITTTGLFSATASTGIGSADAIETTVGSVNLSNSTSGNIQVTDADSVTIAGVSQSVAAGELRITAGNAISSSGAITSAGNAFFVAGTAAGDHIEIGNSGNNFSKDVYYTISSANDLTVYDSTTLALRGPEGGGALSVNDLTVTAAGITQLVNITASGTSNLTHISGGSATDLSSSSYSNDFQGTVNITSSADFKIKDTNNLSTGTTSVSGTLDIEAGSNLSMGSTSIGNTANLVAGGSISQTGAMSAPTLTLNAGGAITLSNTGNNFNTLGSVTRGGALNIYDNDGLTISGNINSGNTANDVTIRTGGDLIISSGVNITTTGAGNDIKLAGVGGKFYNYAGTGVFSTDSRWVVYAKIYGEFGGLNTLAGFQRYSTKYADDHDLFGSGSGFYWEDPLVVPVIPLDPIPDPTVPTTASSDRIPVFDIFGGSQEDFTFTLGADGDPDVESDPNDAPTYTNDQGQFWGRYNFMFKADKKGDFGRDLDGDSIIDEVLAASSSFDDLGRKKFSGLLKKEKTPNSEAAGLDKESEGLDLDFEIEDSPSNVLAISENAETDSSGANENGLNTGDDMPANIRAISGAVPDSDAEGVDRESDGLDFEYDEELMIDGEFSDEDSESEKVIVN